MTQVGGRVALPYVAALDGLRAIAVAAVVAYHASLDQTPGGFFGVDVFFVISGFLVTALFLARARDSRGPDTAEMLEFWRRRLLRLVPAALGAVALTWLVFVALNVRSLSALTSEAVSAIGYFANWFFLFGQHSYFETISAPSPFLHFWSLAVEAQFYLLWPLLLIGALRFGGRLSAFALAISLAAISTLVVASLYSPVADPSRAYYGTDARVAGLLLGAALAIVVRPGFGGAIVRVGVEASGWLGLVILAYMVTQISEFDPFIYRGGFFVASTATLGVMLSALHGRNSVAWILSRPVFRWVGERSYSIYLWHWPVFVLTQPQLSIELRSFSLLLARLGMTLILAELSYRLVENRFRAGGGLPRSLPRSLPRINFGEGPFWRRAWVRPTAVVGIGLVAVVIAGGLPVRAGLADTRVSFSATTVPASPSEGLVAVQPTPELTQAPAVATRVPSPTEVPAGAAEPTATPAAPPEGPGSTAATPIGPTATPTPGSSSSGASSVSSPGATPGPATPQPTPVDAVLGATVTAIGDSVMLGAAPALEAALPGAVIDAEVGRQFWSSPAVIEGLREQGALGDVVVIHLGANGPFTEEQFGAVRAALEGVRAIVFVNVTVPRRWEAEVNDDLVAATDGLAGVAIADWNGLSAEAGDFLTADGVHLTPSGQKAYVDLIRDHVAAAIASLRPPLPDAGS